jgi:hypothetical protein
MSPGLRGSKQNDLIHGRLLFSAFPRRSPPDTYPGHRLPAPPAERGYVARPVRENEIYIFCATIILLVPYGVKTG